MSEMPRTLKIVTVWLLAGLSIFLGFKGWEHYQQKTRFQTDGGVIEIKRSRDGHYHWPGKINGENVEFLIDTGATSTAISQSMARELKLKAVGQIQSHTAGGTVAGSLVRIDLQLRGGVIAERLPVVALQGLNKTQPLLGMDVLGKLRWQQREGVLIIDLRPSS
jgi:aspartyl protease family protein